MRKDLRRIIAKLRDGTAELRIETGRWCDGLVREREVLKNRMAVMTAGFDERGDKEKVTLVLDEGCIDLKAEKAIKYMWRKKLLFCGVVSHGRVYWVSLFTCYSIAWHVYFNLD